MYHSRQQVEGDVAGVTTRGVCPHAPVNHTVFFLCHVFIKFMYINKILIKQDFKFLYYMLQCELLYVPTRPTGQIPTHWQNPDPLDKSRLTGKIQTHWTNPDSLAKSRPTAMKARGPDSMLYHVIHTQPWHKYVEHL